MKLILIEKEKSQTYQNVLRSFFMPVIRRVKGYTKFVVLNILLKDYSLETNLKKTENYKEENNYFESKNDLIVPIFVRLHDGLFNVA